METSLAPEGGGRRSAPLRADAHAGGTPRKAKGKESGEGRERPRAVRGWFNNGWKGRSAHSHATPTPRHLRAPVLSILWWLGVIRRLICRAMKSSSVINLETCKQGHEQSACSQPGNSNPSLCPSMESSATLCRARTRMPYRRIQAWPDGDTCQSPRQQCNHSESGAGASVPRSMNRASAQSRDADAKHTKRKRPISWPMKLLLLGACVYLPVLPLLWTSTTSLQPPMCLLLATQGWLSMSLGLLVWSWIEWRATVTPNARTDRRGRTVALELATDEARPRSVQ